MSATERRRIVDQIRFNVYWSRLIGIRTEFVRRNAKKVEKIGVEQRIDPELVRFKCRIGNLIAPQGQAVASLVSCSNDSVTRGKIITEQIRIFTGADGRMSIRPCVWNCRRSQQLRLVP